MLVVVLGRARPPRRAPWPTSTTCGSSRPPRPACPARWPCCWTAGPGAAPPRAGGTGGHLRASADRHPSDGATVEPPPGTRCRLAGRRPTLAPTSAPAGGLEEATHDHRTANPHRAPHVGPGPGRRSRRRQSTRRSSCAGASTAARRPGWTCPSTQEAVLDALDGLGLQLGTGTATTSVVATLDGRPARTHHPAAGRHGRPGDARGHRARLRLRRRRQDARLRPRRPRRHAGRRGPPAGCATGRSCRAGWC